MKGRVLQAQFRGIKGHDVAEFKDPGTEVIITPAQYKSGNVIYPYEKARVTGRPTSCPLFWIGLWRGAVERPRRINFGSIRRPGSTRHG